MNIEESIQQIETLIEAWQLDEADLNQTDINAMQTLLKENQELKKQLEERNIEYFKGAYDTHDKYYTQQKEFIKYLENKKISPVKSVLNSIGDKNQDYNMFKNKLDNYEEILQKYKEITGVSDEKK
jgi:hypothetical protein